MQADGIMEAPRKNWDLDTTNITEVFTLALSLEDLNFIATFTAELLESGLIPPGISAPWIVNVHDLEIATELLERPSELVHFRSEEHTSELQSLMRISYAVFCLTKKKLSTSTLQA